MNREKVNIGRTSPQTLERDIGVMFGQSTLETLDFKQPILIKINGNYDRDYPGSNTSKWFLDALLKVLIKNGFQDVKVMEGDLPYFTASQMAERTGLREVLDVNNVSFIACEDLPRDRDELPMILKEAQLINVPVFHSHGIAVMSCATKNLFGLLPKTRRKYHSVLSEKLLDLYEKVKCFTIVDGTVGLVGESTRRGIPQRLDLILAGWDTLAIDFVVARIMGFSPHEVPFLKLAIQRGMLKPEAITLEGEFSWDTLPRYKFQFNISKVRTMAMKLECSFLESRPLFRWLETHLERMYHNYSYFRVKKQLFSGPWMEYDRLDDY